MRPQKITFGDMREMDVRGVLIYCADYHCSHSVALSADRWPARRMISSRSRPQLLACFELTGLPDISRIRFPTSPLGPWLLSVTESVSLPPDNQIKREHHMPIYRLLQKLPMGGMSRPMLN